MSEEKVQYFTRLDASHIIDLAWTGKTVRATFSPQNLDTLRPTSRGEIGKVLEFQYSWVMDGEDPHPGVWALTCKTKDSPMYGLWTPEFDLKNIIEVEREIVVNKEKWMITFDDENWQPNNFGEFDSFEAAQKFVQEKGKQQLFSEWCDDMGYTPDNGEVITCTVGMYIPYAPAIDSDFVIDTLRDDAYEFAGEYSDSYLDSVTEEEKAELTEQLNRVFHAWAEKYNKKPHFYQIAKMKEIE